MNKLIVTVLGMLTVVLLIGSCGVDTEGCLDDFFEEYFSECVSYCDTCVEWADSCNIDYQATACVESRWSYGSPNDSCISGEQEVITMLEEENCQDEKIYLWHCLSFQ